MIYSKVTLKDLTPIILDLSKCLISFFFSFVPDRFRAVASCEQQTVLLACHSVTDSAGQSERGSDTARHSQTQPDTTRHRQTHRTGIGTGAGGLWKPLNHHKPIWVYSGVKFSLRYVTSHHTCDTLVSGVGTTDGSTQPLFPKYPCWLLYADPHLSEYSAITIWLIVYK